MRKLLIFFSPGCHNCIKIKSVIMTDIEKKFKDKVAFEYRNIDEIQNYKFLLSLRDKYKNKTEIYWPVFFFEGEFLNGRGEVRFKLEDIITKGLAKPYQEEKPSAEVDLVSKFRSIKPIAITIAGLEDGINPCAFTVIVFFISFLSLQGYRRKELLVIGLTFIFAVFLTYFLLGLGIFNFLYSLKVFRIIPRILNVSIGIFSIVLGAISIYDFYKFKKTGKTEGLVLQLPKSVKNQIHSVIGMHYRKTREGQSKSESRHIVRLFISALITGFLVSLLEAVCTGQLYLPTITFVLKTTPYKLHALAYLLYYNLLFVVPLFVIFCLALFGVTSGQFARFMNKHLLSIKIAMAILFISLGIFLIWRA